MATEKNITMKQFNGTDYDTLYPKTTAEQVEGIYSNQEVLSDSTKELYGLRATATPNDVFAKLAMPYGYYGFDVTTVLSDGTPVPFVVLNGLQDISGNTPTTDENGRCSVTMSDSKTPTVTISDYIGVADTETTISAKDDVVFTPVTITLERDTSMHLIQTSKTLKVLSGAPVDMCIVGGGASGTFSSTGAQYQMTGYSGGGGGYAVNIMGVILESPFVTLVVGSGGMASLTTQTTHAAGGDTSITYNNITTIAEGAKSDIGNGSSIANSDATDGTVHVFNDDTLPLPGGGGGYGKAYNDTPPSKATNYGGQGFGGNGGFYYWSSSEANPQNGKGPGGGGGGGAGRYSGGWGYVPGAHGASGGLYIRVNAPEVSV